MRRRDLSDDIIVATEANEKEVVELLGNFDVGEYWEKSFPVHNPDDTSAMMKYVETLRQEGLDIGKGDARFGYRMPIPEEVGNTRYLHVFRRR